MMAPTRIVLAATGASGLPYAVSLARTLASDPAIELHLIVSEAAKKVLALESDLPLSSLTSLAHGRTASRGEVKRQPRPVVTKSPPGRGRDQSALAAGPAGRVFATFFSWSGTRKARAAISGGPAVLPIRPRFARSGPCH